MVSYVSSFFLCLSFFWDKQEKKKKQKKNKKKILSNYRKSIPDITQQINKWYNHFVCLSVTQFEVHSICEPCFSQQNEAAAAHKNSKQTIKYGACILQ